jgi:hypothetical protein
LGYTWFPPRELLRLSSGYTWTESDLEKEITLENHQSAAVFGIFIQWLYTGKYTEREGPVMALYATTTMFAGVCTGQSMRIKKKVSPSTMEWSVKAAVLAWELGEEMKAPDFQNHAMTRLLTALFREHEHPQLTPNLYDYIFYMDNPCPIKNAVEDIIIKNWGDGLIMDYTDRSAWKFSISIRPSFKDKFIDGMMFSFQERREQPMVVEKYFVSTKA